MRFRPLSLMLLLLLLSLSACSQTPPQAPVRQTQRTGGSLPFVSGTVTDAPSERTPTTTDSLEVSDATGTLQYSLTASGTVVIGKPDHPRRLIVFLDYDCTYCRRFVTSDLQWIERAMIKTNRLAVERVFVPMSSDGDNAARLALCAAKQEKFPDADHWLVTHAISAMDVKKFAKASGLHLKKLTMCIAEKDLLTGHWQKARDQRVERVPFFVLGGSSWLGLLSREELSRTIKRALKVGSW